MRRALVLFCFIAYSNLGCSPSSGVIDASDVAPKNRVAGEARRESVHSFQAHHDVIKAEAPYLMSESAGLTQSPINISTSGTLAGKHSVHLHYQTSHEHITNTGHTIQVSMDPGSSLEFDGLTFELVQFHFHTPSEHLIDGMTFPMELHLVHVLPDQRNRFLVVAVLFKQGPAHPLIETLLPSVPEAAGAAIDRQDITFDVNQLFSDEVHYYHYEGSLTTPPYSESVTWLVLSDIHTASEEQITKLNTIEGDNARHIQSLHTRKVDSN